MDIDREWFQDYDEVWAEYRQAVKGGIHTASDNKIRDLHARLATLLSELQLFMGELAKEQSHLDVQLDTAYNFIFVNSFDDGKKITAVVRDKLTKVNPKYGEVLTAHTNSKADLLNYQWRIKSLETSTNMLSREISVRISK